MLALLSFLLTLLTSPCRSKSGLAAENAALRRQVAVLLRKIRDRIRLTNAVRLFFVQLYRWFRSILNAIEVEKRAGNRNALLTSLSAHARSEQTTMILHGS
jgi:hypothetical protein